jgi:hypothetical protein
MIKLVFFDVIKVILSIYYFLQLGTKFQIKVLSQSFISSKIKYRNIALS